MKTIFRQARQRYAAPLAILLAMVMLALMLAWMIMIVWIKGGPQPVHRIVIALPAPQMSAMPGHRA